jgi:glutamine synthetase
MNTLREDADKLETIVDEDFWLLPTYGDMLFNI